MAFFFQNLTNSIFDNHWKSRAKEIRYSVVHHCSVCSKFSGRPEYLVSGRKRVASDASREGAPKTSIGRLKEVAATCRVNAVEMGLATAPITLPTAEQAPMAEVLADVGNSSAV